MHCYTQHTASWVNSLRECDSLRVFFFFFHCKYMEAYDPRCGIIFGLRGMAVKIYMELYII